MTRPASDALSLALPKARGRTRIKRPRKPTGDELWALAWCVLMGWFALDDFLDGAWLPALYCGACSGLHWRGYHRLRRAVRPAIEPRIALALAAAAVPVLAAYLAGVGGS